MHHSANRFVKLFRAHRSTNAPPAVGAGTLLGIVFVGVSTISAIGMYAGTRIDASVGWLVPVLVLGIAAYALYQMFLLRRVAAAAERSEAARQVLLESIEITPNPIAIYDSTDKLVAWNRGYEELHEGVFEHLKTPIYYHDLVRAVAQQTMSPDDVEEHVAERVADQRRGLGEWKDRTSASGIRYRVTKMRTPSDAVVGIAIDITELYEANKRLEVLATTDTLTNLANRRRFLEVADYECMRSQRFNHPLCVLSLDVDHFKRVNDTYGHAGGDEALKNVAELLRSSARKLDTPGRLGGEEFCVLLPETPLPGAFIVAERIRESVASSVVESGSGRIQLTVSIGIARREADELDIHPAMERADAELYRAKNAGRNRIYSAPVGC